MAKHKNLKVYIKDYIGSPLKVIVSLVKHGCGNTLSTDSSILRSLSSLGLSLSTFDSAPITVNSLIVKNIFGDSDEVFNQLKSYYLTSLKQNALSFIGASSLIGNPIKFINTLGTGFEEFYYEPYQGFMTGGITAGSLGIAKGTVSLVKNAFSAGIGSSSKILQSLSQGMLTLTGDQSYI